MNKLQQRGSATVDKPISYFDRENHWENAEEKNRERIEETLALIPNTIERILNAGCGDGRVTNSISSDYKVFGVDLSASAVRLFQGPALLGSLGALPFRDNSFDLVLATEVLEHLSDSVYFRTLKELQRVAKHYILITVPNDETLEANFIKCDKCNYIYHAWTHLRKFGLNNVENLFDNFFLVNKKTFGPHVPKLFSWPYFLLQHYGNTWSFCDNSLCPNCGSPCKRVHNKNLFGFLWERLIWRYYAMTPWRIKYYLAALYQKRE